MEKISVIVPVYKVENYLKRCVDSIINQSYKNLEIILVDDGSPDKCPAICDGYAEKDPRIKVIHKKNGGLSSARNAGLDIATGDYIGFVDSDDMIHRDFYKILLYELRKNGCDIVQTMSRTFRGDTLPDTETEIKNYTASEYNASDLWKLDYIDNRYCFEETVWRKLYKAQIFENIRFREGIISEDDYIKPELIEACGKFVSISPEIYFYYRSNPNSITKKDKDIKYSQIEYYCHICDIAQRCGTEYANKIILKFLYFVLHRFARIYSDSYYSKDQIHEAEILIRKCFAAKTDFLNNIFIKIIWKTFTERKFRLLRLFTLGR